MATSKGSKATKTPRKSSKPTTAEKTAKQAAPALDPATLPDDELKTELKALHAEYNRRADAAKAAKQKRLDELLAELTEFGIELENKDDETDGVYRTPEGPTPPRAYDLRDGTFRPICMNESNLEDNEQEWAERRAWVMLGSLIGSGILTIPDLDLLGDKDESDMIEHLRWMVQEIGGVFIGNSW